MQSDNNSSLAAGISKLRSGQLLPVGSRVRTLKCSQGFTLIELMIAVAILAIIMAIAIPSYQKHVVRSNRVEAKTILMQTAQALERCYTRYNAYNDSDCKVGFPIESESGWYKMTKSDQTINDTDFELVAKPQKSQATRDSDCKNFTLSHNGTRGVSGSAGVEECW